MPDTLLALLLTVGLLATFVVWVPLLHGVEMLFRSRILQSQSYMNEDSEPGQYKGRKVA